MGYGANRIVRTINPITVIADAQPFLTSSISINAGDFCVLDTGTIRAVTSGDTGANFLGIMTDAVSSGKLVTPYVTDVDAAQAISAVPGPMSGVVVKVVAKTGDAFTAGCKVYLDVASGTYHVTSTAGSLVAIGIYQGATVASASAGQLIEVYIKQTLI